MDLQQFGLTGLISWPAWSGLPGWTCDVERMLWAIFGLLAACFVWSTKGFIIGDNRRTHRPLNAPDFTEHATNLSGFPNTLKPHPLVNRDRHTSAALPIASTEVFRDLEDQHNVKYGPPSKFVASNSCPILFEPPKTREKAFPNRVPCRLSLCLEHPQGTPIRHEHNEIFSLEWLNGDTFSRSIEVAEDYVTQVAGDLNRTEAESARKVSWYRKSLQYCIVELVHKAPPTNWLETMDRTGWGRGGSVNATEIKRHSQNIERDGEWSENLPQSLTRLFGTERRPTFLLDIELCCTIFESHPSDLCKRSSCAKDIRQLLFDKKIRLDPDKQETAEGKEWFIPKGFLEHLFSCDLVEHLINQDEGLSHDPIWCEAMQKSNGTVKGEFVRHVHLFCIRLLASIILAELDLRCLYYLWIDSKAATKESIGIRDANIPLNRANRPHGERYAKIDEGRFETFLLHQGRLKAYDFQENHQKHELIEEGVVIPVLRGDSIGGGMNGPVYKVKVHEDHHRFHPVSYVCTADIWTNH